MLLFPGGFPMMNSSVLANPPPINLPAPPNVIWYPPRSVVLPGANPGTCQAKPTAGPKLFQSFGTAILLGLCVFGPMNSRLTAFDGSHEGNAHVSVPLGP